MLPVEAKAQLDAFFHALVPTDATKPNTLRRLGGHLHKIRWAKANRQQRVARSARGSSITSGQG
jgi:hypothetical protein